MNLLGKKVLECSKTYYEIKNNYNTFEDYFFEYMDARIDISEDITSFIARFLLQFMNNINDNTDDNFIVTELEKFKKSLIEQNVCKSDFDILEFVGVIILGNTLNSK